MRTAWLILFCAVLALGCKSTNTSSPDDLGAVTDSVRRASASRDSVAPASPAPAKIVLVNTQLRYVILDFAATRLPGSGQRLSVYRNSQKIGQIRTSSESSGTNIAADIIFGDLQLGDEVRAD